jgi:DNA-binding XRE family transcriptional regulator
MLRIIVKISSLCNTFYGEGLFMSDDQGERLKSERVRLSLSQRSMAEAGGVSTRTQISYETGQVKRLPGSYLASVSAFGVDVMFVITGQRVENVAATPVELAYLRNCRALAGHGVAKQGLDGLTFLRESKGIKLHVEPDDEIVLDLTVVYQPPTK